MTTATSKRLRRHFPIAVMVTATLLLLPPLVVWSMLAAEITTAWPLLMLVALAASLATAYVARAIWSRRTESKEILFADLMLWRWVDIWWHQRRLQGVIARLGIDERTMRSHGTAAVDIDVLQTLATALEARDPYTHGHSRRVARYSAMIASQLDLNDEQVAKIRTAAAVHDVGKLEVPLEVLNKPGGLTEEEYEQVKAHAPVGAEMVGQLGDPELTDIVAHHHERIDGTGYPDGIGGRTIPLGARIIAVADTFDALTSSRAYRSAKRQREALAILHAEAGTQLDADAVRAFDRCLDEPLRAWVAWPLLVTLPHRLWSPSAASAAVAGGGVASQGVAIIAAGAITFSGVAATDVAGQQQRSGSGGSGGSASPEVELASRPTTTAKLKDWVNEKREQAKQGENSDPSVAEDLKDFVKAKKVELAEQRKKRGSGDSNSDLSGAGGGNDAGGGQVAGGHDGGPSNGDSPSEGTDGPPSSGGGDPSTGGGASDGGSSNDDPSGPGHGDDSSGGDSDAGSPRDPGKDTGRPDNPGNPGKGHGKPADPGNGRGNGNSGTPASPANSGHVKPPKDPKPPKPPSPGKSGEAPGQQLDPESPSNGHGLGHDKNDHSNGQGKGHNKH